MTRLALTVPIAAALLAAAAPADGAFRINRSMEGVALGMTDEQVRAKLGRPDGRTLGPDFVTWRYRRPALEVTLKPDVITLFTRSRQIRGAHGIGVGTTERRLRQVVKRVRCRNFAGQRLCVVGTFATGRKSTVFAMRGRRVTDITISVSTP